MIQLLNNRADLWIHMRFKPSVLSLLIVIFIDSFGYFIVIPVLMRLLMPGSESLLPADVSQAYRNVLFGIAIAISPLASLISAPIIGRLSDHYGRKPIMLICLFGSIVGFALPIFGIAISSLSLVFLGRFIAGGASSSQPVAQAAMADLSEGTQKAWYLSLMAFAMTAAMVLGPLAGGYLSDPHLVSWFNSKTPLYAACLLSILNWVLLKFTYYPVQKIQSKKTQSILSVFQKMCTMKIVTQLLLIMFLLEAGWSLYYQDLSLFFSQVYHFTPEHISDFMSYTGIVMGVGLLVIYPFYIRLISMLNGLMISLLGMSFGLVLAGLSDTVLLQYIAAIPIALFTGFAYISLVTLISDEARREYQGWVMGAAMTMLYAAWMFTGLISGWLTNFAPRSPMLLASVFVLSGFGIFYYLSLHRQKIIN